MNRGIYLVLCLIVLLILFTGCEKSIPDDVMDDLCEDLESSHEEGVLDMATLIKTREAYKKEDRQAVGSLICTMFKALGWFLVTYSLMLIAAWNVDVNVDLGFGVLEKLTLGKWVAVKTNDELPNINSDDTNYVTFRTVIISCIILIAVGALLIAVNAVNIMSYLVSLFGGLSDAILKIISG